MKKYCTSAGDTQKTTKGREFPAISTQKVQVDQTLTLGRIGNPLYGSSQRLATLFGWLDFQGPHCSTYCNWQVRMSTVCLNDLPGWHRDADFGGPAPEKRCSKSLRFSQQYPWPSHGTGRYIYHYLPTWKVDGRYTIHMDGIGYIIKQTKILYSICNLSKRVQLRVTSEHTRMRSFHTAWLGCGIGFRYSLHK